MELDGQFEGRRLRPDERRRAATTAFLDMKIGGLGAVLGPPEQLAHRAKKLGNVGYFTFCDPGIWQLDHN